MTGAHCCVRCRLGLELLGLLETVEAEPLVLTLAEAAAIGDAVVFILLSVRANGPADYRVMVAELFASLARSSSARIRDMQST